MAASRLRRDEAIRFVQTTSLVHDAFLRLVAQRHRNWQSRAHFFGAASEVMRRILVDRARRRHSQKRDVGAAMLELHDEEIGGPMPTIHDTLVLDEALSRLGVLYPRQLRVVQMRYFCGLSLQEIAEVMGTTTRTIDNDWALARAWLSRELRHAR